MVRDTENGDNHPFPARLDDDGCMNLEAWFKTMNWSHYYALEPNYSLNITAEGHISYDIEFSK